MSNIVKNEPVATTNSVVVAVVAVLAALVSLNVVHFSADQITQVQLAVAALLAIPATFLARSAVTPNPSVEEKVEQAVEEVAAVAKAVDAAYEAGRKDLPKPSA